MKKHDQMGGLIWFVLGICICIGSMQLGLTSFNVPGPGFLPFLCGATLGIFGLILLFSTTFLKPKGEEEAKSERSLVKRNWKKFLNPLLILVVLLVYILLLETLGFLLTTFICLLFLFKLSEPGKWLMPLALSFMVTALTYLIFSLWLQCQFPKGLIRFW
jgi:putative tricarboxylic transport membrane protein